MGQLDACLPSWVIPVSIQLLGFHGLPTRLTHTLRSLARWPERLAEPLTPNQKKPEKVHYGDCPTYSQSRWEPALRMIGPMCCCDLIIPDLVNRQVTHNTSHYGPHGIPYLGDLVPHLQSSIR